MLYFYFMGLYINFLYIYFWINVSMIEKKLTVHKEKSLYNMFTLISMTIEIYTTNIQIGTSYDENINMYWMGVLLYYYIFIRDRIGEENGGTCLLNFNLIFWIVYFPATSNWNNNYRKNSLKIPKRSSETIYRVRTDNAMTKWQRAKKLNYDRHYTTQKPTYWATRTAQIPG